MATIGVLALQGGFAPHLAALADAGHRPREVRAAADLADLAGLVLPGGESTAQWHLLAGTPLESALGAFIAAGAPVLATCAGLILVAKEVRAPAQPSLALLEVVVERNAYGRQLHSFEGRSAAGRPLIFIRAPRIVEVGAGVEILDRWQGEAVLVRQGALVGATFHPELTGGHALHAEVFARLPQSV